MSSMEDEPYPKQSKGFVSPLKRILALILVSSVGVPLGVHAFNFREFIKDLFGPPVYADSAPVQEIKPFPFLDAGRKMSDALYDVEIVDDISLASHIGPLGNIKEAEEHSIPFKITTYTVRPGDNLSLIAQTFGVSVATIRWANDIPRGSSIQIGDVLVILPVSGVRHTVKSGDTVGSIAKKYGGDINDIANFNGIAPDTKLAVGMEIVIPDGEGAEPQVPTPSRTRSYGSGPSLPGYFVHPLPGGVRSRGIHGYNAIDVAGAYGSGIRASASGEVIIARGSGWNGGYGSYVVISHPNGTQTLYAHMSSVYVSPGQWVTQGTSVGGVGSTGKSTGPHLHFEVRGARNPF